MYEDYCFVDDALVEGRRIGDCNRNDAAGLGRSRAAKCVSLHRQLETKMGPPEFFGFRREGLCRVGGASAGAVWRACGWPRDDRGRLRSREDGAQLGGPLPTSSAAEQFAG